MGTLITALVLLVIVIWVLASCIKIVPQAQAYVVERLGAYQGTWSVGLHVKVPFIDRVASKKSCIKRAGSGFCTTAGYHKG